MLKTPTWLLGTIIGALVLIWGTTWAAIRIGLEGVPPFTACAIRFAIAGVILAAIAPHFGVKFGTKPYEKRIWLINGMLLFGVSYGVVYWAEQWVPSGLAAVLFASFPLFVTIFAHFQLSGERLTIPAGAGVLLGFVGVAILYSEDFEALAGAEAALAALIFIVSPVTCAIANIYVKKRGADIHPVSITAGSMVVGTIAVGSVAFATERNLPMHFDTVAVACILYLAVIGTAVAFGMYFWVLKKLPATKLALIAYGSPIVAVTLGCLFLDEPLTLRMVLGAVAILGGVWIAGRAKARS